MFFTGFYEHSIDAKHRLAIPADIRSRWSPQVEGDSWFAVPWKKGVIRIYTERDYMNLANSGPKTLALKDKKAEMQATMHGLTARMDIDGSGRIRLPEHLLRLYEIGTEVVLVGAGDRLEIRNRQAWLDSLEQRMADLPGLMEESGD